MVLAYNALYVNIVIKRLLDNMVVKPRNRRALKESASMGRVGVGWRGSFSGDFLEGRWFISLREFPEDTFFMVRKLLEELDMLCGIPKHM